MTVAFSLKYPDGCLVNAVREIIAIDYYNGNLVLRDSKKIYYKSVESFPRVKFDYTRGELVLKHGADLTEFLFVYLHPEVYYKEGEKK